jgi:hypothetical protein
LDQCVTRCGDLLGTVQDHADCSQACYANGVACRNGTPDASAADSKNEPKVDCQALTTYSGQLTDVWLKWSRQYALLAELKNTLEKERACLNTLNALPGESAEVDDSCRQPSLLQNILPEVSLVIGAAIPEATLAKRLYDAAGPLITWYRENVQKGAIDAVAGAIAVWSGHEFESVYGDLRSLYDYAGHAGDRRELIATVREQISRLSRDLEDSSIKMNTLNQGLDQIKAIQSSIAGKCGGD